MLHSRLGGLATNGTALLRGPLLSLLLGLSAERLRRSSLVAFATERCPDRLGASRVGFLLAFFLAMTEGQLGASARSLRSLALLGRRQFDACPPRLGKADGNRLFCR